MFVFVEKMENFSFVAHCVQTSLFIDIHSFICSANHSIKLQITVENISLVIVFCNINAINDNMQIRENAKPHGE